MSSAMDKALMAMRIEEEDEDSPFDLPDLPEYKSNEQNSMSIIGRLLNPERPKMASLILDLPTKWQKVGMVNGVALSKERFQFFFKYEQDLEEILEKGVHTDNEWTIAVERWVEHPPVDSLQYIPLWVQIRNIPVNHRSIAAITTFGELVSQVTEVAYDPYVAQTRDYIRVQLKFDVSRPLRRSKVVNIPGGGSVTLVFDYERVQKRCYTCQRLTHDQDFCPIFLMKKQGNVSDPCPFKGSEQVLSPRVLKEGDLLFGVLKEDQVGIDPITRRPRMADDVLEGMRQYLVIANGEERKIREERVKNSIREVEKDLMAQKTVLRLKPAPVVSRNMDKG